MSYTSYKKLTKAEAKKLFDAGKEIYLHTNKLSWNNPWQNPMPLKKDFEGEFSQFEHYVWCVNNGYPCNWIPQFRERVNNYSYYNCDNERGNVVIYLQAQN